MTIFVAVQISIHAPAKGATYGKDIAVIVHFISIHAPAKGATYGKDIAVIVHFISIHAPAKGATHDGQRRRTAHHISIHAPAKERLDTETSVLSPMRLIVQLNGLYIRYNHDSREGYG